MCDFPLMNLNVHACYLLSVIKMAGIEADYDSITVNHRIHGQNFTFKSPIFSIEAQHKKLIVIIKFIPGKEFSLKIQKPMWWNENSKVIFNDLEITNNSNIVSIQNEYVVIIIKEEYEEVKIVLK